jgi:hypothetical protein
MLQFLLPALVMSFPIVMCLIGLTQKPQFRLEDAVTRGGSLVAVDYSGDSRNRIVFSTEHSAWRVNVGYETQPPHASFGRARTIEAGAYDYTRTSLSADQWHAIERWKDEACQRSHPPPLDMGNHPFYRVAFRCGSYTNVKVVQYRLDDLPVTIQQLIHLVSGNRF